MPVARIARFATFAALLCLLAAGCGGDKKYRISGKVTYKGAPVPSGKIYFLPDAKKGGKGPGGHADIIDGAYDTSAAGGSGQVGGPMTVRIEGFDPSGGDKNDKSGEASTKPLFPPYETAIDLPKETTEKNFDVPAAGANPTPGAPGGGGNPAIP